LSSQGRAGEEGGDFVVGEARPPNPSSPLKGGRGSVGEGETGKKAKTTPDAGGKSVSEKSQVTRTSKNLFEKSCSKHTEDFVCVVKENGLGRMVLSSSSGDVTFLLTKMIRGNL
jgi:hypothetical protein